ncbi:MAG: hypothetical protein ACM65M_18400 [Microcoleus sp.]
MLNKKYGLRSTRASIYPWRQLVVFPFVKVNCPWAAVPHVCDRQSEGHGGLGTITPSKREFSAAQAATLCGKTEYNGSVFEEEITQIASPYWIRPKIISPATEHKTIGKYLEKRIQK